MGKINMILLIDILDKWIEESDRLADEYNSRKMVVSESASLGASKAYWNVKKFIEINFNEKD